MSAKALKLVHVTWIDSASANRWVTGQELLGLGEPVECESIGWLIKESKTGLLIAAHISKLTTGEIHAACGDMAIPRAAITKVRTLR